MWCRSLSPGLICLIHLNAEACLIKVLCPISQAWKMYQIRDMTVKYVKMSLESSLESDHILTRESVWICRTCPPLRRHFVMCSVSVKNATLKPLLPPVAYHNIISANRHITNKTKLNLNIALECHEWPDHHQGMAIIYYACHPQDFVSTCVTVFSWSHVYDTTP